MDLIDFQGAARVPLIGRHSLLEEVEQRVRRGGSHVLYFEGEGGIGKTALLEATLEHARQKSGCGDLVIGCVASEIVDLYHADVHTIEGLVRKIVQVTNPAGFAGTLALLHDLDGARGAGDTYVVKQKTEALQQSFLAEFAALAQHGVVVAFDTIEVLAHEHDPFQEELGEEVPILSAGEWILRSFLPGLVGHTLILLAGRPSFLAERFETLDERLPVTQVACIQLAALEESESRAYLESVAELQLEDDRDAADRLASFVAERGEIVHFLTGGRPILLALVADMVAHGWALPPAFGRLLDELQQRGGEAWRAEIEWALVVRIQESPTPIGDTLRSLAWLRKGATAGLLARVMDLTTPDGKWDVEAAHEYLKQAARLALVKVRPADARIFLHDEMYALLEKHVLQTCSDQERDRVYSAALAYYDDEIRWLEQQMEAQASPSPVLRARLRELRVEEMHYRLRHRPQLGFAMYFWLAEQALDAGDAEMDMLLRTELLRTLVWLQAYGALAGLDPWDVRLDGAVRWGARTLFLQNEPQRALDILDRIYDRWDRSLEALDLTLAHLQLYRAVTRILRGEEGDWQEARLLLARVAREVDEALGEPEAPAPGKRLFWWQRAPHPPAEKVTLEARRWRARMLKASAVNYQGYLDRQQGRYVQAVAHYQASAMLQRRLALSDLAPVLINLSFAMALTGEFRHARLLTEEAEGWARRGGSNTLVLARALNARALVEVYDHHPRDALRYAGRALDVAAGVHAPRLHGLIYLTRARAHRYLMVSEIEEDVSMNLASTAGARGSKAGDEALKDANQAVNLLKSSPTDRIAALIERGCLYREIARGYIHKHDSVTMVQVVRRSEEDLRRAATVAGAMHLPDQAAAAWANLGWLWYYAGQLDSAFESLQEVRACIPADYFFPDAGPLPAMAVGARKDEACLPFWSILGKSEMLVAYIALDRVRGLVSGSDWEEGLGEAATHITLSLAYNSLVAEEHFDLIRAEGSLHRRILEDELSIPSLHRYADQVAADRALQQPTRFQQFLVRMFGPATLWL
ncbi:MAG: ATP-binding protein [Anaerolineae bacterium]|nr:ATP-binding protein [Anaerolineae bacterium]